MRRMLFASLAGLFTTCCAGLSLPATAQNSAPERPATLQPQTRSAEEIFTDIDSAGLGLRPPAASLRERVAPAYGLRYHRESKSLLMPLDNKDEWTMGLNLNLNATPNVETAPSGLNLQPRRTPGLFFQKKF